MYWKRWGATLDRLPAKAGLPLGIGAGAVVGALLLLTPAVVWVPAFLVLFVGAGFLAWSGEPVEDLPPQASPAAEPKSQPSRPPLPDLELVSIPAGRFLMGSPEEEEGRYDNEGPVHEVGISAFHCMKTPVTRRLYASVMGTDPGWPEGDADDRPINKVNWLDAIDFCNRLSEREGLAPCYKRMEEDEVTWHREAGGYRLPTETEWEYSCRAGTQTRWSFGNKEERLADHAWFQENAKGTPQPVGRRKPNPWGLHDVHGNVWEWCWDRYGNHNPSLARDPAGPTENSGRVLRGGSFRDGAEVLRSAIRGWAKPVFRDRDIGFRCVRGTHHQP